MSPAASFQPSRRSVLGAGAAAAVLQIGTTGRAEAAGEAPPNFPEDINLHRKVFQNWDKTITTDALWTSTVRSPEEVVKVVNWAHGAGYTVRPRGFGHSWSPVVLDDRTSASTKVVLVDTTRLSSMSMVDSSTVRVQAGVEMQPLLAYLAQQGRCFIGAPAPGDVSVGGVLAVNGHGTNLPGPQESSTPGATYGTLSNTVVELTAVVWDKGAYRLKTFHRTHADIGALLVSLGRTFITEAVLKTVPNYTIRCRNYTHLSYRTLFAEPGSAGPNSLSALLDKHGRVGLIWFAMTETPWVQVWDVAPRKPLLSRWVGGPNNYAFADNLPDAVADLIGQVTRGAWHLTPVATNAQLTAAAVGLTALGARDMWGEAKNFIHFVKPTTLKVSAGSHVVITRRADVQKVVHGFTQHYLDLINEFRREGAYPANNTCEIRVTGLDRAEDIGVAGAQQALLSGAAPVPGRPELDTAVWLDVLNLPGSPRTNDLFQKLDQWFIDLPEDVGVARPEWAKRFGNGPQGPWTNTAELQDWLPGQVPGWDAAVEIFERLDPHDVYRAPWHDRVMPKSS
ncbi:cholesterol oxidase substrate-binding domain-containing protein [Dermacoccaceae bacterium W4C1]